MQFTWLELVDRVKVYLDDDHNDNPQAGWLSSNKLMKLMQVEYRQLYRKWLRAGLINVEPMDVEFVGPLAKVSAIVPAFADYPTYDGLIRTKLNGAAGNGVLVRFDDSGTGTGTLVEQAAGVDPAWPYGTVVFEYQTNVTTFADFEAALANSILLDLITPSTVTPILFTTDAATITSGGADYIPRVLAVVGVAQKIDDDYRPLRPMTQFGRKPFRNDNINAPAMWWSAFGPGDNLAFKLTPADQAGTYVVRYIQAPANETSLSATVELPYMGDERLVLGTLQRAGIRETTASGLVNKAIMDADAELQMEAAGKDKEGGVVIRKVRRDPRGQSTPTSFWSPYARDWTFYSL
jgi:hypothetical protein